MIDWRAKVADKTIAQFDWRLLNRKQKEQLLRSLEDAVPLVPEPRATSVDIVTGFSARCASVAAPCLTNADAGYASVRTIARSLYRPRTVA